MKCLNFSPEALPYICWIFISLIQLSAGDITVGKKFIIDIFRKNQCVNITQYWQDLDPKSCECGVFNAHFLLLYHTKRGGITYNDL